MGDVGVGKTMFLRHLIKVDAKQDLKNGIVLYIDYGKEAALTVDLGAYVLKRAEEELLNDYSIDIREASFVRGVYHLELLRFERSTTGQYKSLNPELYVTKEIEFLEQKIADKEGHLKASLNHLSRARNQQIAVFLDNIDQRPVEFQEKVFIIAQSIAETWPVAAFVALRPDTFYHSRTQGSLAAYQPRVFTVSPPRIDLVITRRFEFALEQLKLTGQLESFRGFSLDSRSLVLYLSALLYSFQRSNHLMELLKNVRGGNVREALSFVEAFVGSGHVDALKIVSNPQYVIPIHEFLRAILYGDHELYDPGSSPICNLFDISTNDGREHFLLPNLLAIIERQGSANEGFVEAASIFSFAQELGFQAAQIHFALDRAIGKKLLETNPKFTANPKSVAYRITTVGAYTVRKLATFFSYVDAVVVDTPILDPEKRALIVNVDDIGLRLERARHFVDYLDTQWKKMRGGNFTFKWNETGTALADEIRRIAVGRLNKGPAKPYLRSR